MRGAGPRPSPGDPVAALLAGPLRVIAVGLEAFAEELAAAGVPVVPVDWRPPAGGDRRLLALLAALEDEDDDVREGGSP